MASPKMPGLRMNLPIFEEPQCLIETGVDGGLHVNQAVIEQLQMLDSKLVVVAIAGLYRTGKSYLMNRLAGKNAGFALGSTIQSKTKGIWIWVRPHPKQPSTYLVLLDTEGLGDAEKGDANYDNWIFTLSTLLSSTLVYNFLGAINDDMITKLSFVSEISKRIKTKESDSDGEDADFDLHFPLFIMALRDFCLDLEIDGQSVTADQYLEHLLILGKGRSPEFIESRRCIRKYFKTRKCFTFDRPTTRGKLRNLETLDEHELNDDFLEDSQAFTEFVYQACPVMKLPNGTKVTGPMFASLVGSYVTSIREGALPCVQNAFMMMAEQENRKAIEGAVRLYRELLEAGVVLPTETEQELGDINSHCQKEAIGYFASKAIMDIEGHFQKALSEELLSIYVSYDRENRRVSYQKCQELLNALDTPLRQKLQDGYYACAGGFLEFDQDLETLKDAYRQHTGLGVEKAKVLDEYINATAATSASILAADEKMTVEEKKVQEMKQEAFRMESQRQRDEEEIRHLQQLNEEKMAVMEETKIQMEQKHEEEMMALTKQQAEIQEKRMREQERLLKEGFKKDAEKMKLEIENSRAQFMEEQKHIENLLDRERQHQKELMEAKLREAKLEHEYLLQLEKQKGENQVKEEKLRLMEESAREAKEAHEAMVEKMSQMNLENMNAMERMHQDQLKAQHEQQVIMRDMERSRMEQDMERARLEAQQRKEERERQMKWEKEQQAKLEAEKRQREEMERNLRQQIAAQSRPRKGGSSCIVM